MPTFNAADIIGKTLIAKKSISLKRLPNDDAAVIYTVGPGQSVGVVTSYLLPNQFRSKLYWSFEDSNNNTYYAAHNTGDFDVKELADQGVLTLQQQQQAAQEANLTTGDKIFRLVKNALFIAAGAYLLKTVIQKKL